MRFSLQSSLQSCVSATLGSLGQQNYNFTSHGRLKSFKLTKATLRYNCLKLFLLLLPLVFVVKIATQGQSTNLSNHNYKRASFSELPKGYSPFHSVKTSRHARRFKINPPQQFALFIIICNSISMSWPYIGSCAISNELML